MKLFRVDTDPDPELKELQFLEGIKNVFSEATKAGELDEIHWGPWSKPKDFEKELKKLVKQVLRNQWKYAFTQGIRTGVRRFCSEGFMAIIGKDGGYREGG